MKKNLLENIFDLINKNNRIKLELIKQNNIKPITKNIACLKK